MDMYYGHGHVLLTCPLYSLFQILNFLCIVDYEALDCAPFEALACAPFASFIWLMQTLNGCIGVVSFNGFFVTNALSLELTSFCNQELYMYDRLFVHSVCNLQCVRCFCCDVVYCKSERIVSFESADTIAVKCPCYVCVTA